LEDTERNLNSLRELKKLGISIALDDFGVGYSFGQGFLFAEPAPLNRLVLNSIPLTLKSTAA
jgi:EAL domain-containing protein (putative c-di-GMP-specific phosphodiesterase class I)